MFNRIVTFVKSHKELSIFVALVLFMFIVAMCAPGCASDATSQAGDINVTWQWTAPTTGSAAVGYIVEVETTRDGVPSVTTTTSESTMITLAVAEGADTRIRVAGYDSIGRTGPFSLWSDPFIEPGAPGQPGKPGVVE